MSNHSPPTTAVIVTLLVLVIIKGIFFAALLPAFEGDDETDYWAEIRAEAGETGEFRGGSVTHHGRIYAIIASPIYYATHSLKLEYRLFLIRLLGVILYAAIIYLVYEMSRLIWPNSVFIHLAAPMFLAFNPKLSFVMATVSSDVFLIFIFTTFLFLMTAVIIEPTKRKFILLTLVLIIGALTKKRFLIAFPLTGVIMLTAIPALVKKISTLSRQARQGLLILGIGLVLAVWQIWPRAVVFLTSRMDYMGVAQATVTVDTKVISLLKERSFQEPLFRQFWGFFAWHSGIHLSEPIYTVLFFITLAAIAGLLVKIYASVRSVIFLTEKNPSNGVLSGITFNIQPITIESYRRAVAIFVNLFAMVLVIITVGAYQVSLGHVLGRYLLTGAAPLGLFLAAGLDALIPEKLKGWGLITLALGLLFLNLLAITAFLMQRLY